MHKTHIVHARTTSERGDQLKSTRQWASRFTDLSSTAHNTRGFFNTITAVYEPACHGINLLLKDNEICWKKHFEDLLNRNSMVEDEVLEQIPQQRSRDELETLPICMSYTMSSSR